MLVAADKIIIPVQAAYLSIKGLEQLIKTIGRVRVSLNNNLGIDGILITMLNDRTIYAREIVELLNNAYGKAINIYDSKSSLSYHAYHEGHRRKRKVATEEKKDYPYR